MMFFSIPKILNKCRYARSLVPSATAMGTTSMEAATSKAGPPAGREASDISAVTKATERAGVHS